MLSRIAHQKALGFHEIDYPNRALSIWGVFVFADYPIYANEESLASNIANVINSLKIAF